MQLIRWLIQSIAASLLVFVACSDDGDSDGNGALGAPAATDVISGMPVDEQPDDDGDGGGASPFELLSPLTGEWSGTWNNDTFGFSGRITMSIVVNEDGTASFSFDIPAAESGWPFGLIAIGPQAFDGTYDENGLSVIVRGDGLFGDVNVSISLEGDLVAEATMTGTYTASALTVLGSFDGSGMDITYTVELPDGPDATGSATLTKS